MNSSPTLTSFKNPKFQFVHSLIKDKKTRDETGFFIAEGVRLAEEVINRRVPPQAVFFSSKLSARGIELVQHFQREKIDVSEVKADILDRLSDTETSQGILLVLPQKIMPVPDQVNLALIIDQLRDPGNMGTILRSAAAVGVGVVFVAPGSVDPFMPKVVRAAMGAHFHLPVLQADWALIRDYCKGKSHPPLRLFQAEAGSGNSMWQTDLTAPLALIIGGEAEGPSLQAREFADALLNIPMPGQFESLNAGVATSLLLYEVIRQRNS